MNLIIDFGPQFLALTLALIQLRRLSLAYKLVLLQLCITIITDAFALYTKLQFRSNEGIYNVYVVLEMVLLSSVIYQAIENYKFKKLIKYTVSAFLILASILLSISSTMLELNYPILIIAFISIAFFNLYFIIHPKTEKSLIKNPMMIIAIGHVIYFLGVTPYFVGRHFLIEAYPEVANVLFSYINMSLSAIRYLCIATAFGFMLISTKKTSLA